MINRLLTAAVLLGWGLSLPALADSYKFNLQNNSKYEIIGFETFEDSKWSKWTGVSVKPGETQVMNWNSDAGDCEVPFRIIYKDVETEQYTVDWCKISNVEVQDDKVTAN